MTFSNAPSLLNLAAAQFPDVGHYPEGLRALPIGSELLSYDWELLNVSLIDATAADMLVTGPFSNAWQTGKPADACGQPQPAELALLTPFGDLWLHALADAGAGLAEPPLPGLADICHLQATARFGWALGEDATREGDGWRLPPNPRSADPLQSQPRVLVELMFMPTPGLPGSVLTGTTAALLPLQFAYTGSRVRSFAEQKLDGRSFDGWLDPGAALAPPGDQIDNIVFVRVRPLHELRLLPDEALFQPHLWLVFETRAWTLDAAGRRPFAVTDDLARTWLPDEQSDLGGGFVAVRWLPPAGGALAVKRVQARCVAGLRIGVLGLGGITQSAVAAAAVRNAAAAAEADKQNKAAAEIAAKADAAPSTTRRCVLDPGRLYRIDVTMRWSGTLWQMDDQGKKQILKTQAADGSTDMLRQYWFRTAPLQPAGAAPGASTVAYLDHLHRRRDLFDPAMLQRHLLGYNPAQSELQRFANDPVQVHFAPGHVALLAAAYKFELLCALRRLDQPDTVEPDQLLTPKLVAAVDSTRMVGSAAIIGQAYLDSGCGLAANGVVLHADVKLTRDTWYEVFVLAKKTDGVDDGRLPGVSFRTSRWADGAEMLQGLRFLRSGAGLADGGVALPSGIVLAARISEGDDGVFDAFLATLGLDGWPTAAAPRASLLWIPPAGPPAAAAPWRCAGLMLESPEPIHRPGRFVVDGLDLLMGPTVVNFDLRLRDRSGSRLLFATSTPFVPRRTRRGLGFTFVMPRLRLRCTDLPIGAAKTALQGLLELPLQPSFAEEAQ